jgi:hypothetical protein
MMNSRKNESAMILPIHLLNRDRDKMKIIFFLSISHQLICQQGEKSLASVRN